MSSVWCYARPALPTQRVTFMISKEQWDAQVDRRRICRGLSLFTFLGRDQVPFPHDHPQHSLSMIVSRHGYTEVIYKNNRIVKLKYRHPFVPHFRRASTLHRVWLYHVTKVLIFSFGRVRPWGFFVLDRWVGEKEYLKPTHYLTKDEQHIMHKAILAHWGESE